MLGLEIFFPILVLPGLFHAGHGQEADLSGIMVQHRHACVSADSCGTNMYSIECSMGEKIAMLGVNYGAKPYRPSCPWSSQACVSKSRCCLHEQGDCLVPYGTQDLYDIYKKCSHAQQCGWLFAKSADLNEQCTARKTSNYVMADFFCVNDRQFIDVCSQYTVQAKTVHLHHSAIPPSQYNYPQCSCLITPSNCSSSAKIMFRAIDIRLQSRENWTLCNSNSRVELIGQNSVKTYRCKEGSFLYGLEDFYTSEENNLALFLYKEHRNYPTKLWLEVQASEPGVDVKVTCGPRSLQTARRCPAVPISTSGTIDQVIEVPERPGSKPTVIHIDEDYFDPDQPNPDGDEPREKKNPAIAAILGGVAAGIVVLVLLLVLVCLILRKKNRKKKEGRYSYKAYSQDKEETHQVNYYETVADPLNKMDDGGACQGRHPIYHQPWGNQQGFAVTRAKPSDLAYATSEEIKVLIEKMEKDRQYISEGQGEAYPAPDPTYYRHIDNYKFRYSGHDTHDEDSDMDLKNDHIHPEAKSNGSDNSGTEHLGSEDSKVEADRHLDSDIESQKVEAEAIIQTYYDGYESPRLSTFHPVAVPQRKSVKVKKLAVPVEKSKDKSLVDNKSDDVPVEHAPSVSVALERMSQSDSTDGNQSDVVLANYREPENSKCVENQSDETGSGPEDNHYSPVYDEIPEK